MPWAAALLVCGGCAAEKAPPSSHIAPGYTVADFDPAADPFRNLADTVSQAEASGKRILLEIGGRW